MIKGPFLILTRHEIFSSYMAITATSDTVYVKGEIYATLPAGILFVKTKEIPGEEFHNGFIFSGYWRILDLLPSDKQIIFKRDNFTWRYCRSKNDLTVDHITPTSKCGTNSPSNLVTACIYCNQNKADMHVDDFVGHRFQLTPRFTPEGGI